MKIKLLAFALTVAASTGIGFADVNAPNNIGTVGIFGFGIELDATGSLATNNGVVTLYALDNSGTGRLIPTGSTATIATGWTNSSTGTAPTFNLGTFTEGSDTLILDGGSMLTYKNSGQNVNGTDLVYRITPGIGASGSFASPVSLSFNQDNVSGNSGDQRWSTESLTSNLLTGLSAGTYTLDVYGYANTDSSGTFYVNGGTSANFGATFTVAAPEIVPEPSTWAMMLGGLGLLVCCQRLRRKPIA